MPKVGFDCETNGLEFEGEVASMQFYFPDTKEEIFLPLQMVDLPAHEAAANLERARNILLTHELIGANLMYDVLQAKKLFPQIRFKLAGDSWLLSRMAQIKRNALKRLVVEFGVATEEEVVEFKDLNVPFNNCTLVHYQDPKFIKYAMNDAIWAVELEEKLRKRFPSLLATYENDLKVQEVFVQMQYDGMKLNYNQFVLYRNKFRTRLGIQKDHLNEMAGFDFRLKSRADLKQILFEKRHLPHPTLRTPKGDVSLCIEALEQLAGDEFIDMLLGHTHDAHVLATFETIERYLPKNIDPENAILHPQYLSPGVDGTSRVYTEKPAANQLPKEFRSYIVAEEEKKFAYFDWSAAELMLAAYWGQEQWLIDAYNDGQDLHKLMSSKLLNKDISTIGKQEREVSKVVTFSVMFGSEGGAAARKLGISFAEAAHLVQKFWDLCPAIKELRNSLIRQAHKTGATKTITGRQRRLAGLNSYIEAEVKGAERQVFNTAIQGSVADLQKIALIKMNNDLFQTTSRLVTTVFDSFTLEVPLLQPLKQIKKYALRVSQFDIGGIKVKFLCDVSEGRNYFQASS